MAISPGIRQLKRKIAIVLKHKTKQKPWTPDESYPIPVLEYCQIYQSDIVKLNTNISEMSHIKINVEENA